MKKQEEEGGGGEEYRCSYENSCLVQRLQQSGVIRNPFVINAFLKLDRGNYTKEKFGAYLDAAQEIGYGQEICSPQIYGVILESIIDHIIGEKPTVLVVGSGSGYLCSVIGNLINNGGSVFGIERIKGLADRSISNIMRDKPGFIDTKRITIEHGNGWDGSPSHAPYDVTVVCAAAPFVPQPLIDQLRTGGILIIPLWNSTDRVQWLCKMEKLIDGTCTMTKIMPVL